MRSSIPSPLAGLLAAATLLLAAPAQAAIVTASGAAVLMAPPGSVVPNAGFEHFTVAAAFNEQQNVTLARALQLDALGSGTFDAPADLNPGLLAAGTLVSSHYLHADPVGSVSVLYWYSGSVTFDTDILGVAVLSGTLTASDLLGAPGTTYGLANGFDLNEGTDSFTISADRRTLDFTVAAYAGADALRVITAGQAVPEPGGLTLAATAFGALLLTRRHRPQSGLRAA